MKPPDPKNLEELQASFSILKADRMNETETTCDKKSQSRNLSVSSKRIE